MSEEESVCRACLKRGGDTCNLYDGERGDIPEKITFCTGLQIRSNDGLPSNICIPCVVLLESAFLFKTRCLSADASLRRGVAVKAEPVSDCEDEGFVAIKIDLEKEDDDEDKSTKNQKRVLKKPRALTKPQDQQRRRRLWCEICSIKFANRVEAKKHMVDTHKKQLSLVCEFCGKSFKNRSTHYYHLRSHMPPRFSCDQCPYTTWHKQDLEKHNRTHSGVKEFQCDLCTAAYVTVSNLRSHIRRTHERRRDHSCHICSRTFFDKRKLEQHLDAHNDIKRFVCEVCGAALSRRNYWSKHMLRQHDIRVESPRPGRQKSNYVVSEDTAKAKMRPPRVYTKRKLKQDKTGNEFVFNVPLVPAQTKIEVSEVE